MKTLLQRFAADQSGATAIEYALIAVIVSIAIVASMRTIGDSVIELFDYIVDNLTSNTEESQGG
ncbi:MAG: Flp family type IVb pilin [Salinarimonas sp.]